MAFHSVRCGDSGQRSEGTNSSIALWNSGQTRGHRSVCLYLSICPNI